MRPQEIGIAEQTEEIDWRHVWLKSVLIDGGNLFRYCSFHTRRLGPPSVSQAL